MHRRALIAVSVSGLLALPLAAVAWLTLMAPGPEWVGPTGNYLGLDFVNFWSAGKLALAGLAERGYDDLAYKSLLREWFSPATGFTNLSYPPHLLPLLVPFAALPYFWAYALWSLLGTAAFVIAILGRWPRPTDAPLIAALLIAPALLSNLAFGQIALFATLLFIGAFRLLPQRPVLAGVLLGLLTVKPQLGLLVPLFLIAIGAWRTIAAATVTTAILVALSLALFGLAPWRLWLSETAAIQWSYIVSMNDFYAAHMVTPYAALWWLGLPVKAALAGQWLASAGIAVTTALVARSSAEWPLKVAVLALGSVMVVPYVLAHDLAVPLAACVWYFGTRTDAPPKSEAALLGFAWLLPFPLCFLLQAKGLPLTEPVLAALYVSLAARALAPSLRQARMAIA